MAVDETLAGVSNAFIYSAMLVYTGALAAFAVDLSGLGAGARRETPETARVPATVTTPGGPEPHSDRASALGPTSAAPPARRRRAANIAISLTWLAFALHVAGVAARGLSVHRPPWGNMYEFTVAASMVVTGAYLLVQRRRDVRYLGAFVVGPVLLALGLAVTVLYTQAAQLVPALHSYWLGIHVSVAFVATALFTLGASTTVLQLIQDRREAAIAAERRPRVPRFMAGLPAAGELERSAYRLHAVAFPLWTFAVMAGAIWADAAWGKYWNWDPKEVWSFVVWVVYAGYLHARATRGWNGRRAAYLALAGYACVLFNFGVVNVLFVGLHSYAGVG